MNRIDYRDDSIKPIGFVASERFIQIAFIFIFLHRQIWFEIKLYKREAEPAISQTVTQDFLFSLNSWTENFLKLQKFFKIFQFLVQLKINVVFK